MPTYKIVREGPKLPPDNMFGVYRKGWFFFPSVADFFVWAPTLKQALLKLDDLIPVGSKVVV